MKLTLERSELAILVLHLNIMRDSIKKGFKVQYGALEGRKKLKEFDELKTLFEGELDGEIDPVCFVLDTEGFTMLHSFINWYLPTLKQSLAEKSEQILILDSVKTKINNLVDEYERGIISGE